ncbi:MAG: outer membrane protein assembly factor BamD [Opitutales bacterium]
MPFSSRLTPPNRFRPACLAGLLAALFLAPAATVSADWWNPLDWFSDEASFESESPEEMGVMGATTPEEEAEAAELLRQAEVARSEGRDGKARRLYAKIRDNYARTEPAPDAMLGIARILKENRRYHKAFEEAQAVLIRYPDYEGFLRVIGLQFDIASALQEGARNRAFGFIPGIFKSPNRARGYFEALIQNAPYSDYAPMALMNIALISKDRGEEGYAIDSLDRLITFYPDSMLAPDAYYTLAEIYASMVDGPAYDQGSTREAISYYEDFLILFPNSPYVDDAEEGLSEMREVYARSKYDLGEFYYRYRNNTTAALVFYNETITVAPNTNAADEARQRITRIREGLPSPGIGIGLRDLLSLGLGGGEEQTAPDPDAAVRFEEELEQGSADFETPSGVVPPPLPEPY